MTDVLTPEQRHFNMSQIKGKNTKPEIKLRKLIFNLGYRYRLNVKNLPGKPDLVFSARKKIIFVHGCYWHMHQCKYGTVSPKSNADFWKQKRLATVARDKRNIEDLQDLGWEVLVIWECELKELSMITSQVIKFLG